MTEVRLEAIGKRFGPFTAIDSLDLAIGSGELVALLGPSGCGKTTTLRVIAGLETPTAGRVLFDGRDMSDVAVQKRNVGMVFQRYALFPHMTVEKNITFGLDVRRLPRAEIAERLEDILDVVQLGPFRTRFPAQLSGGQMQRVAIARTLITKPSVLMMDEPLANLDTKLRGEMRRFIRDLQKQLGITTIFVTHDQVEAMELADRVAVIFNGKLAQYGPPQELYQQPKSTEVADFMGASNIFAARLVAADRAEASFGTIDIAPASGVRPGADMHVMLRSESIDLFPQGQTPATAQNVIAGRIKAREFFGASVQYVVRSGTADIIVAEQSRRLLDVGQPVELSVPPERVWTIAHQGSPAATNGKIVKENFNA